MSLNLFEVYIQISYIHSAGLGILFIFEEIKRRS